MHLVNYCAAVSEYKLKKPNCVYNIKIINQSTMKISEIINDDSSSPGQCRTYVIYDEDPTLGNSLRAIISKYPDVAMCGYSIPHPAESKMHFRIQTTGTPALEILKRGLKDLERLCEHTLMLFEGAVKEFSNS